MTKSELINAVATRTRITKSRSEQVVNCVFEAMTQSLIENTNIEIRGFGSFQVRPYPGYMGRNPRTGEAVPVPPKRSPFFKAGKELKELVNDGEPEDGDAPDDSPEGSGDSTDVRSDPGTAS